MTIEGEGAPGLLTLLTWFSPAFPVGAFAYSHGLEAAVAQGRVTSAGALFDWVETLVLEGSGWNDLVLLAEGMRRAEARDAAGLDELAELALALSGSAERREETRALGEAFGRASLPWGAAGAPRPYPLAVAERAAASGAREGDILAAYAHAFAANLVSAAVRLVPLGQSEAVAVMKRLEPVIAGAAHRAGMSTLDDLGSSAILSDIAAMRHESLPVRLFRT
ncbi:urease accessory protein UreF [Aureimonas populi]|uniref:Urease accessory protein UreF n=1 Tax=Aureimonas populi TaxID=1701758 RepID=A0ABW5CQV1_9HYPH|nr:urease accessory protein UreF [Aureimonas populi]